MHTSYADEDSRADAPVGYSETQYIKLYDSVLDDREIQRLPAEHFRFLLNCWLLARRSGPCLGTPLDIAFKLRIPDADAEAMCAALPGYLTLRKDGKHEVRNWAYWQASQKSTDRVRKSRAKKKAQGADGTHETNETFPCFHETTETNRGNIETSETIEKKRKEKRREEDVAAVAATRAVPPPPARRPQQQQPEFLPFSDEPDVQALVSEAVEDVAQFWPMLGNVPNAKRVWERHAVDAVEGAAAWCRKIRQTALIHFSAHEQCRNANGKHFIPTLERWVQDGDYSRKPPTAMEQKSRRLIDMFPEVPHAS